MSQPRLVSLVFDGPDTRLLLDSLSKGADPNQKSELGIPALYVALQNGYDEVADILIDAGAVLDEISFIDIAINLDDTNMASCLIEKGVLGRLPISKKVDFLCWASASNLVNIISVFLEAGLDVGLYNSEGHNALHSAVISPKDTIAAIELLLAAGANSNQRSTDSKRNRSPLHLAALVNSSDLSSKKTGLLLEAGADCNTVDNDKHTPLHLAINSNNNATVQLLLSAGVNIDAEGGWMGRTPLMFAVTAENREAFDMLIDANCNIHILDQDNTSAIGHLIFQGHKEPSTYMLWCLLMLGGDPNSGAGIWKYPLHTDLNYGGGKFSRMLIFFGADLNVEGLQCGSALAISVRVPCSIEITKMLLDASADVNGGCRDALRWAVGHGHIGVEEHVELLLEAGANVYGDREDLSILEEAILMQRTALLPILFKYGAHADMVRYAPLNPLGYIRQGGYTSLNKLKILEIMLEKGAKVNNRDAMGMEMTPLHTAAREASLPHVRLLLEAEADPNDACLKYSMTPLHYVAGSGSPSMTESWRFNHKKKPSSAAEIVDLLLEKDANPLALDKLGRLPLHYASGSGNSAIAEMLLQSGGSESARTADDLGSTPLHLAASSDVVKILIENGALVSARDKLGRSPLQTAARREEGGVLGDLLLYCSDEELKSWKASPRGSDSIAWYVFKRFTAWIFKLLSKAVASRVTRHGVTDASTLKIRDRRQEEDILHLFQDNLPTTTNGDGEVSLTTIRVALLVFLVSVVIWRLL